MKSIHYRCTIKLVRKIDISNMSNEKITDKPILTALREIINYWIIEIRSISKPVFLWLHVQPDVRSFSEFLP